MVGIIELIIQKSMGAVGQTAAAGTGVSFEITSWVVQGGAVAVISFCFYLLLKWVMQQQEKRNDEYREDRETWYKLIDGHRIAIDIVAGKLQSLADLVNKAMEKNDEAHRYSRNDYNKILEVQQRQIETLTEICMVVKRLNGTAEKKKMNRIMVKRKKKN